jgi:hypothetical protein
MQACPTCSNSEGILSVFIAASCTDSCTHQDQFPFTLCPMGSRHDFPFACSSAPDIVDVIWVMVLNVC